MAPAGSGCIDGVPLTPEYTHARIGTEQAGWLNFQSLWDEISSSDPDLFD